MVALFGILGILTFFIGIILFVISLFKKTSKKKPLFIILGSVVLFGIAMVNTPSTGSTDEIDVAVESAKDPEKESKDETIKTESSEKEKESVSVEFKNALIKGQQYADRMNMSERAIYDQLVSEYGENFPEDAAQYAIENIKADYNNNALEKAKTYQSRMSMSRDSIWEQLVSEHGENFTEDQANYALENLPN
ncbi:MULTISPECIES: Ltp family lipoprotein [Erysipelothrix]|uniref:Ltp family lipoprotein n=1 Tax=Erysipelothrix TaxID=1647 RepID=UPI001F1A15E4|nr:MULTISPECIES: Ltp family lipoprotein [unclassified Erysipelothrix]